MNRVEILNKIKEIVNKATDIPYEELREDAAIMDDLEISSLEVMVTIADIEDEFNITISETDMRRFVTIHDIAEYVTERIETDL